MKTRQILFCIFCVILVLIIYNLYKSCNTISNYENIENFSILEDLNNNSDKKKKKKKNNNDNDDNILDFKKSIKSLKSKKTGTTFDDLFKAAEDMKPEKLSMTHMLKELSKYNDSFKKEKFNNNSKNTAESLEKFKFYKEQFFNIFK